MIDKDGNIKCNECGKKFGVIQDDKLKIVCHRCNHYNVLRLYPVYQSHKVVSLEKGCDIL